MSLETTERLLSLEEFEELPEEDDYRLELSCGRLVREPPPGAEHSWLTGEILARLHGYARERGLGLVVTNGGFVLSDDPPTVREPDIAFISAANVPKEGLSKGFWRQAPDLAVEVVSPSSTATEMLEKVLQYLGAGCRAVWVVEPESRTIIDYHSRDEIRLLTTTDFLEGGDILPRVQPRDRRALRAVAPLGRQTPGRPQSNHDVLAPTAKPTATPPSRRA
jgi:Uma2 family endonuclease